MFEVRIRLAGRGAAAPAMLQNLALCFFEQTQAMTSTHIQFAYSNLLALHPRATLTCTPGPSSRRVKCMAQEQLPRSSRRPGHAHSWLPFTAAQHSGTPNQQAPKT